MSQQFESWFEKHANGGIINFDKKLAEDSWLAAKQEIIKQIESQLQEQEDVICISYLTWEKIKEI